MSTELENVKKQEEEYSASNIQVLEGLEAVRKRPAMYIGDIGEKGLHHLVYEVVDNSIDEALAGYCTDIDVTINEDNSITVRDNGRGIPTDYHEKEGKSALEVVLTVLHAGGKFDKGSYKVSGGLHGVGVSCVNALSPLLIAEIRSRDGKVYRQTYSKGAPTSQVEVIGECSDRGTTITFKPDESIFTLTTEYKYDILANRLRELAFLNKGIRLNLYDKRKDDEGKTREDHFYSEEGLKEFVQYLDATRGTPIIDQIIYLDTERNGVPVEVAMQYNDSFSENVHSYVNNINTIEGGTHLTGFRRALTRTLKKYAEDSGMLAKLKFDINGDDFREGLTAVVSVKVAEPQFEGQTKTKLDIPDAGTVVANVTGDEVQLYFDRHLDDLNAVIACAEKSAKIRKAEEKAKTNMLTKQKFSIDSNGKLANCESKNPEECEVFIVEGDSAGGSAKTARNRRTQAILPIRGKILNVEKASIDKVLANAEIKTMINSFNCGFLEGYGNDFDISKLRYNKIIIMTDADVDGAHIDTLLLTFFYRFMPELINQGHVYIATPPLYKVVPKKGEGKYLYDDKALEDYRKKHTSGTFTLQRYKGLGEMDPDQLWETTLNPETRILKQVEIEDARLATEVTAMLMGTDVPPRREFIYTHANEAEIDA